MIEFTGPGLKILDFDIECRPLSWLGGDWVTKEITAIACRFIGTKKTWCWLLGKDTTEDMLDGFRAVYDTADMVTGHFIRSFDLPVINSAMIEFQRLPLEPKLSHDTKNDLVKRSGVSVSQESLAAMLGVQIPKVHMTQADWREANRLTPKGLAKTRRRVVGDVAQHIAMRERLIELKMLRPPSVWSSTPSGKGSYHA